MPWTAGMLWRALSFSLLVVAGSLSGALAQTQAAAPPARDARPVPQKQDLNRLFELLKQAPDVTSAKLVERRIWVQLSHSGSDTADLLMARARTAIEARAFALGIDLLDRVLEIKPAFAEAWHRRATARFLAKDYAAALTDLNQALVHEPRHFAALAGLGMIFKEIGRDKEALAAFRQALAIHPHLERVPGLVKDLAPKVDGREI